MAKMTLDELVAQLKSAFGDALRAVVLYGSAAAGEHVPKKSDTNVLIIVETVTMETLTREAAIARAWSETGNPPPMTLTLPEWRSSSDIFPMEYADVLERHRVLFGALPTDGVRVDPRDLRLQLEHEAMSTVLRLRQGVLRAGNDRGQLIRLLRASLSTVLVIFRAVLRLHQETPPADNGALTQRVAGITGLTAEPILRVIYDARGTEPLSERDITFVLAGYLGAVQQLVAYLDRQGSS